MEHYQVRLVKRIENDGTIVTFPDLGKMYQLHDQKTLKSYHSLNEATTIAQNLNSGLPSEVKGMVIVRFKPGRAVIATGSVVKPHILNSTLVGGQARSVFPVATSSVKSSYLRPF